MNPAFRQIIDIPCGDHQIECELTLPQVANAIVIFVPGDGTGISSPRSRIVALSLQQHNFGTLIPNLLDAAEARNYSTQYDINLLSTRLSAITKWLIGHEMFHHYPIGYFATSTGAAAAFRIASLLPDRIDAIVCRGGRPDLAAAVLPLVTSPTLFLVGELDKYVLELNAEALEELPCTKQLEIIEGANHLFEGERINEMTAAATAWFQQYLHVSQTIIHTNL